MRKPHIPLAVALLLCGCLPPPAPETEPVGPISIPQASIRIQERRSDNGNTYKITHECKGEKFEASWELANALKRQSKLQLKRLPVEWTINDVKAAMQVTLDQREPNPWYRAIDATILSLMDQAFADNARAVGVAPESPYKVAVKVNQHTSEWFVEVDVRIVDESGDNVGL